MSILFCFNALITELSLSKVSSLLSTTFKPMSALKITEFCLFGDIIFDVTRNTMFTNDKAGDAFVKMTMIFVELLGNYPVEK